MEPTERFEVLTFEVKAAVVTMRVLDEAGAVRFLAWVCTLGCVRLLPRFVVFALLQTSRAGRKRPTGIEVISLTAVHETFGIAFLRVLALFNAFATIAVVAVSYTHLTLPTSDLV